MQATAAQIKPISNFIYRSMQVGILLVAAGTFLGGWWADVSWGRFWGWDPKEVWALITLLVYLIPLHGRFAGWVNTFWLVMASVACFLSVLMAWYGVNFVLGVGLHSYGFTEGGSQGTVGDRHPGRPVLRRRRPSGGGSVSSQVPSLTALSRSRPTITRGSRARPSTPIDGRARSFPGPEAIEVDPLSDPAPLVLINAVGLTGRLLAMAPRLKALADSGLEPAAPRGRPGRHLHGPGEPPDRPPARGARGRRQRLVLPRHRRGPVLAAVERPDPGRADLRHRPPRGPGPGPVVQGRPSCSGGSTRGRRSTSASPPSPITRPTATRRSGSPGRPRA